MTMHEQRINLNVPFLEKDKAKSLGAKWCSKEKTWFTYKSNPNAEKLVVFWGKDDVFDKNKIGKIKKIYCCGCGKKVNARLTSGYEVYPHRKDLHSLPFWKCDVCKGFVGCHHKTSTPTVPLGNIPTDAIKKLRIEIHAILDPLWKSGVIKRSSLYAKMAKVLGIKEYHTANIKTLDEAKNVLDAAKKLANTML